VTDPVTALEKKSHAGSLNVLFIRLNLGALQFSGLKEGLYAISARTSPKLHFKDVPKTAYFFLTLGPFEL
jgi:hypothetical protein